MSLTIARALEIQSEQLTWCSRTLTDAQELELRQRIAIATQNKLRGNIASGYDVPRGVEIEKIAFELRGEDHAEFMRSLD